MSPLPSGPGPEPRWKGIARAMGEDGILGIFKGGFTASAVGISGALVFGYLGSLVFKPKMKG